MIRSWFRDPIMARTRWPRCSRFRPGPVEFWTIWRQPCASPFLARDCGPRTRQVLTMAGASGAALSLLTDYEYGAVRKIPMTVRANLDASSGVELLLASATWLRDEPVAGRWA